MTRSPLGVTALIALGKKIDMTAPIQPLQYEQKPYRIASRPGFFFGDYIRKCRKPIALNTDS